MLKTKNLRINKSLITTSVIGGIVTFAVNILLILGAALCISNEYFNAKDIQFVAPIIQFISAFIGIMVAGKSAKESPVMSCLLTGCGCFILELCIALLFFDGISNGFWGGLIATTFAVLIALYLCNKNKKRSISRKKRTRHR